MSENIITVELGENNVKVAKARIDGGKIDLTLLARQADTPPFFEVEAEKMLEDETNIIRKIVSSLKISKKPVNVVLPDAFCYSQIVPMPHLNEKELLSAIKYQADQFIPMPIEETSLDLEILFEDKIENKLLVLIVACPQKLIERVEKVMELSDVFPESIENELSATGRFISNIYVPETKEGGTIFVNIGYSSTSLYYFDHKLKLILDSHIFRIGYALFLREAQVDTNINVVKAIELLKNTGFSKDSSVDLDEILKPTLEAFCGEISKFVTSVKEKFRVTTLSQLYFTNLATEMLNIEKKVETDVLLQSSLYNIVPFIKKTNVIAPFSKDLSSFVSTIGGCLK